MKEQLQYLKQNVETLEKLLKNKKCSDYEFLSMLHLNAVAKNLISDIELDHSNANRLKSLEKCTQIELMTMIVELQDQCEKQKRKLFGLETTLKNLKEKDEKHYEATTYNNEIRHRK